MNSELVKTWGSSFMYLMIGGAVLLAILIYVWIKKRRGGKKEPQKRSEEKSEKIERQSEASKPKPAPEKGIAQETIQEEKSPASTEKELPVFENPIPETEGIDRSSFSDFTGSRILAVDDNLLNLKLIERLMEGSGIVLETASDGREALEKLRASGARYDLVLMDVNMPGMNGLECTREIRRDPQLRKTPVLALTASTDKEEVEKILASGMNGYLDKPIVLGKLFSAFKLFASQSPQSKKSRVMINNRGQENLLTNPEVLDIREGIEHTNNDESLYRSLLEEFLREYAECDQDYQKMISGGQYDELRHMMVDLDGLTGTLGATELYHLVDRIKQIMDNGNYSLLKDHISDCHEAFQRFRREARRYLAD